MFLLEQGSGCGQSPHPDWTPSTIGRELCERLGAAGASRVAVDLIAGGDRAAQAQQRANIEARGARGPPRLRPAPAWAQMRIHRAHSSTPKLSASRHTSRRRNVSERSAPLSPKSSIPQAVEVCYNVRLGPK